MFVRSTVIDADRARLDDGITFVRERVVPLVAGLEGALGLTMLVNRITGQTETSTLWGTRAAMAGSDRLLTSVREQAGALMSGRPRAEEWEVAELYRVRRPRTGFANRSTRLEFDPGDAARLVDIYRTTSVPALSMLDGFASAGLLIDLDAGRGVSLVTFVDRAALEDSRRTAAEIRRTSVAKANAAVTEVVEAEMVLVELHLPDQA
jgi:hypothetical protein